LLGLPLKVPGVDPTEISVYQELTALLYNNLVIAKELAQTMQGGIEILNGPITI
jgi:hypothetical protein